MILIFAKLCSHGTRIFDDTCHRQNSSYNRSNSGIGFEAAAQLAEAGWGNVILACRTEEKAEAARKLLVDRTGRDPFKVLAIDTSEVDSAVAASVVSRN